jgi:hypothetical protein
VFGVNLRDRDAGGEMSGKVRAITAAAAGATWTYVVLDFLVHAVVLAPWWRATHAFWLSPGQLAGRIPFAYFAFASYCAGLVLLLTLLHGEQPRVGTGLRLGAIAGIAFGVASTFGVYSIVQLPPSFLVVGPASTSVASAGAGGAASWVLSGSRRWRRVGVLLVSGMALFVGGIVVQNVVPGLRVE